MKYFTIAVLIATGAQAGSTTYEQFVMYPHNFSYEGSEYAVDTRDMISTDEWQTCHHDIGEWRWHRTKDQKEYPYNHIEEYMDSAPCSRLLLKKLVSKLKEIYPTSDYQSLGFANFLMAFMNGYFYHYDKGIDTDGIDYDDSYKTAWEAYDESGDCEDMATLLMGLFAYSCMDTAFVIWAGDAEGHHATAAVVYNGNIPEATFLPSGGKKYYVAEATANGPRYEQSTVGERTKVMKGDILHFITVSKRNCPSTSKSSQPELPPWMQDNTSTNKPAKTSEKKTTFKDVIKGHWPESSYFDKGLH